MKRDADLYRRLLLDIEESKGPLNQNHHVEGFTQEQVAYHLAQIIEGKLAEGPDPRYPSTGVNPQIPLSVVAKRLTPAGHDFIDNLRDETVWKTVKSRMGKAGPTVALEVIRALAHTVVRESLHLS